MIGRSEGQKTKATLGTSRQRVIRQLIKEGIIIAIIAGIVIAGAIFAIDFAEKKAKEASKVESSSLKLSGKLQTLRTQISQLDMARPLTENIINAENQSRYTLSRDSASAVFRRLRDRHVLEKVDISISSIKDEEGDLEKGQIKAISSTISINMFAYTDDQALNFLDDLIKEMPGIITVDTFELSRGAPFSLQDAPEPEDQTFREPKIRVRIELTWYGFKVKPLNGEGG